MLEVSVTLAQNMTSAACLVCSGDHVRFIGGQSWLSRRSAFCLLWRAL